MCGVANIIVCMCVFVCVCVCVCVCECECLEGNIPVTVCYMCAAYCCIVLLVPLYCMYLATRPLVQRLAPPRSWRCRWNVTKVLAGGEG